MNKIGSTIFLLGLISMATSHTWLGCTKMVNGVCQGYMRNYQGRNTGSESTDIFYTWKALGRPTGFPVCKNDTQQQRIYSDTYPMATAYPGDTLNVMYTPNGHSQPGDHGLSTTSRIHWTGSTTTQLVTREDLTDANRIGEWNFGQNCATTGDVASEPCVNGFQVPTSATPGIYQMVWYWPYDKNQQQVPIGEEYFSCFDVQVLATNGAAPTSSQPAQATSQQQTSQHQTSQQTSNPQSSAATSTQANVCATILADCNAFCAPATPTVCECDPISGKKTLKCGDGEEATSPGSVLTIALSSITAILALML